MEIDKLLLKLRPKISGLHIEDLKYIEKTWPEETAKSSYFERLHDYFLYGSSRHYNGCQKSFFLHLSLFCFFVFLLAPSGSCKYFKSLYFVHDYMTELTLNTGVYSDVQSLLSSHLGAFFPSFFWYELCRSFFTLFGILSDNVGSTLHSCGPRKSGIFILLIN